MIARKLAAEIPGIPWAAQSCAAAWHLSTVVCMCRCHVLLSSQPKVVWSFQGPVSGSSFGRVHLLRPFSTMHCRRGMEYALLLWVSCLLLAAATWPWNMQSLGRLPTSAFAASAECLSFAAQCAQRQLLAIACACAAFTSACVGFVCSALSMQGGCTYWLYILDVRSISCGNAEHAEHAMPP